MAQRTTRKALIDKYGSAVLAINHLNDILYSMVQLADDRSEPLTVMAPILAEGHETIRKLWGALREQL